MSYKYTTKVATRFSVFSQKSWQIWQKHLFCQKTDKNRCKKTSVQHLQRWEKRKYIEQKNRNCIPSVGYIPEKKGSWSGRRGSNSLPPPWQGGALPDELRPHNGIQRIPWCPRSESNQRHADFQSAALPTELQGHKNAVGDFGGNNRARTCDPLLVRQMLSQLSYAPEVSLTAWL